MLKHVGVLDLTCHTALETAPPLSWASRRLVYVVAILLLSGPCGPQWSNSELANFHFLGAVQSTVWHFLLD